MNPPPAPTPASEISCRDVWKIFGPHPERVAKTISAEQTRTQILESTGHVLAVRGGNQIIMMVLAMVVIAGLVGGGGLGLEAVTGLAKNQTGRGIEAGLAIVILAIIIDRITQGLAAKER